MVLRKKILKKLLKMDLKLVAGMEWVWLTAPLMVLVFIQQVHQIYLKTMQEVARQCYFSRHYQEILLQHHGQGVINFPQHVTHIHLVHPSASTLIALRFCQWQLCTSSNANQEGSSQEHYYCSNRQWQRCLDKEETQLTDQEEYNKDDY
mmetsp:Transcript_37346/g.61472  ORF Transcript_37346/g.61472 Transcript_37346/m.61472 type:complete len:149 (+) Transcript_37346:1394-1840(+)